MSQTQAPVQGVALQFVTKAVDAVLELLTGQHTPPVVLQGLFKRVPQRPWYARHLKVKRPEA